MALQARPPQVGAEESCRLVQEEAAHRHCQVLEVHLN